MGADLYITPLYNTQRDHWKPLFEEAVQQCDKFPEGSEEQKAAMARRDEAFQKLHDQGYFRDPYNNWELLWKFGLSWWTDVIPMRNDKDQLPVKQAKRLLDMLAGRENIFALNVSQMPVDEQEYFRSRYANLQRFLNQAIELNTPIDTWL